MGFLVGISRNYAKLVSNEVRDWIWIRVAKLKGLIEGKYRKKVQGEFSYREINSCGAE